MQHTAARRFSLAVAVAALLLTSLQSRAQYAYNYVASRKEATSGANPETGKAAPVPTKLIHGVIQNEQGALPGATVWLQGSRNIVVTNSEGEFEMRVPANAPTVKLVCNYGGLQEEVLTLAPVQAMGSIYLLRTSNASKK